MSTGSQSWNQCGALQSESSCLVAQIGQLGNEEMRLLASANSHTCVDSNYSVEMKIHRPTWANSGGTPIGRGTCCDEDA